MPKKPIRSLASNRLWNDWNDWNDNFVVTHVRETVQNGLDALVAYSGWNRFQSFHRSIVPCGIEAA